MVLFCSHFENKSNKNTEFMKIAVVVKGFCDLLICDSLASKWKILSKHVLLSTWDVSRRCIFSKYQDVFTLVLSI